MAVTLSMVNGTADSLLSCTNKGFVLDEWGKTGVKVRSIISCHPIFWHNMCTALNPSGVHHFWKSAHPHDSTGLIPHVSPLFNTLLEADVPPSHHFTYCITFLARHSHFYIHAHVRHRHTHIHTHTLQTKRLVISRDAGQRRFTALFSGTVHYRYVMSTQKKTSSTAHAHRLAEC